MKLLIITALLFTAACTTNTVQKANEKRSHYRSEKN